MVQTPPGGGSGINVPSAYQSYVDAAAKKLGIPASVVAAQIQTESDWNPNAVSPAGAEGIAQFLPSTFTSYGQGSPFNVSDAFTAYTNYMSVLLKQEGGSIQKALEAYNAGPGDLSAGAGYADSILALAGEGINASSTGTTPAGGGGTGAATSVSGISGLLSGAGGLIHGIAVVLDRFFGLFAKGQGWRFVFMLGAIVFLFFAMKTYGILQVTA